jgi:hypothetical protein
VNQLQEAVQKRNIKYVFHFTRLENLKNIMDYGLIPRSLLESGGIESTFNDSDRIDGCPDASCLSINFPNYKMFWAYRQSLSGVQWVVLAIKARILWEKNCAFCQENAASNAVTRIPLQDRKGVNAFIRLYDEIDNKPSRKDLGISDSTPTNPQAEVLVFDIIESELIEVVVVENQETYNETIKKCPGIKPQIQPAFYSARKDYSHWK